MAGRVRRGIEAGRSRRTAAKNCARTRGAILGMGGNRSQGRATDGSVINDDETDLDLSRSRLSASTSKSRIFRSRSRRSCGSLVAFSWATAWSRSFSSSLKVRSLMSRKGCHNSFRLFHTGFTVGGSSLGRCRTGFFRVLLDTWTGLAGAIIEEEQAARELLAAGPVVFHNLIV